MPKKQIDRHTKAFIGIYVEDSLKNQLLQRALKDGRSLTKTCEILLGAALLQIEVNKPSAS